MLIREINKEELNNYLSKIPHSLYQTEEYAKTMEKQNFNIKILGLEENGNIIGSTILLITKKIGFTYAFAPRGFVIDYNNNLLLNKFTSEIKKYCKKNGIVAIKLNPRIIKEINGNINNNYKDICSNLNKLKYIHLGYNDFFESFKPRFEAIIEIKNKNEMFKNIKKEDYKKLLLDIFEWGSLPQRFSFDNERAKLNYISDVYDSILLKDVVERLNIKDITSFNKILQYVLETEGKEFSANNVLNYLKSEHHEIATDTLYNYLEALCSTFIMNKVYRYDIQGKSVLKTLNKYYASDLGVKKIKTNNKEVNYSNSLENIVYNDLIAKGYEVYIGKTKKGEVDFVATKNKDLKYIQVCYSLSEEETKEREFGAYTGIDDSYTRYVISLDEEDYSRDGIKHINIFDFLMNDDF